jgi:uncharacterized membrane protein AbrB (regulator of aidB expression)
MRVSRILLLVLAAICVFHFWSDGKNISLMTELQQQGVRAAEISQRVRFLCAPLNIAAIVVLIGAAVAERIERWRKRKLGIPAASAQQ